MPRVSAFILTTSLALMLPCIAGAREWHAAESDASMEGELVDVRKGLVTIQSPAGKLFKVKLKNLSHADKRYVSQRLLEGNIGPVDVEPVREPKSTKVEREATPAKPRKKKAEWKAKPGTLNPIASVLDVRGGAVLGSGQERKATLKLMNRSGKPASSMVMDVNFRAKNGTIGNSVPHSQAGFFTLEGNVFRPGQTYEHEVGAFFMKDDTTSVNGLVTHVEFTDGSSWPPLPKKPAPKGDDPVYGEVIGSVGQWTAKKPVVACFNYTSKDVKSVHYGITYHDNADEQVGKTSYGYSSSSSIMDANDGVVIVGGDTPPSRATSGKVNMYSIQFTDGTSWKPED